MIDRMPEGGFEIKFTDREVSAWGGMALMNCMLDQTGLRPAASGRQDGRAAWSGAGHRRKLAPQSRLQYVDSLLPGKTVGMVHGRVEQCGSSTSNSFGCEDSSNG